MTYLKESLSLWELWKAEKEKEREKEKESDKKREKEKERERVTYMKEFLSLWELWKAEIRRNPFSSRSTRSSRFRSSGSWGKNRLNWSQKYLQSQV